MHGAELYLRECRVLEHEILDPAQAKGDDVGSYDSDHDEFYCLNSPP